MVHIMDLQGRMQIISPFNHNTCTVEPRTPLGQQNAWRCPHFRGQIIHMYKSGTWSSVLIWEVSLIEGCFNPLPTNDAPMRHDLSELSISLWEFMWGIKIILGAILQYMVSAYFSCFLWSVKG